MYHWRDTFFQTLRDIALEARSAQKWPDYVTFCEEYERGLRAAAFSALDRFVANLERAPFPERREFVDWLLRRTDGRDGLGMVMPHPLYRRIVEPTLIQWTEIDPGCADPYQWLGGYENLKHALKLNPNDHIARRKLISRILQRVSFATHELPAGYLGSPLEDLVALDEAEALTQELDSEVERRELGVSIGEQRKLIQAYLRRH
jgi:hypothetical protein